jgi:hypothetical protein
VDWGLLRSGIERRFKDPGLVDGGRNADIRFITTEKNCQLAGIEPSLSFPVRKIRSAIYIRSKMIYSNIQDARKVNLQNEIMLFAVLPIGRGGAISAVPPSLHAAW